MEPRKPKQKQAAIQMRKRGYSFKEISEKLGIAKSTCSLWLRDVKLEQVAIQRLVDRQVEGRNRAALTLRQYGIERDLYIQQKVEKLLKGFVINPVIGKLLCAALYWGEGAKSRTVVNFTNSSPDMVKVYLSLFRRYFEVDNAKFRALLHLHSYHNVDKQKHFWSKITQIPLDKISIYKKPNSGINIKEGYPGCISIRYYDIRLAKEMELLYNSFAGHIGGVV